MTPEEIKRGLECCPLCSKSCAYYRGIDCYAELHYDALAYIRQLEAAQPKWISVDERLPDDDVEVLVFAVGTNGEDIIAMTSYTHNMHGYNVVGWRSPWQYFFYSYTILYWMPLPEPPKEDCWQWRGVKE